MEEVKIKPWWELVVENSPPNNCTISGSEWSGKGLSLQAAQYGLCFYTGYTGTNSFPEELGKDAKELLKNEILGLGGKLQAQTLLPSRMWNYVWPNAHFSIEGSFSDRANVVWYTTDSELADKFKALCEKYLPDGQDPEGRVYVTIARPNGLDLEELGVGSSELIRDNYRPEVVNAYDEMVKSLSSDNPFGRLYILDGEPGTGKTYLVRALLNDLSSLKFVILPSSVIPSLAGPEFLTLLINHSESNKVSDHYPGEQPSLKKEKKTRMVLVIEDADSCLASRSSDNILAISNILNMSEGLIGNLLDLRIICTTNADIKEIDAAIKRKGRLSARIEVGKLDKEQAKQIHLRLGGNPDRKFTESFYTLSDVYALAQEKEMSDIEVFDKKRKVGFCVE